MNVYLATKSARWSKTFFPSMIWSGELTQNSCHLTFDDGPYPQTTPPILEILNTYNTKATFFLLGKQASIHPELVDLILQEGHEIANHSFTHLDGWKTSSADFLHDFERMEQLLLERWGILCTLLRPPFGHFTFPLIRWAKKKKKRIVLWDTIGLDFRPHITSEQIVKNISLYLRNGSVILLHDNPVCAPKTVDALPALLDHIASKQLSCEVLK